jgi:hypothetical protein
VCLLDPVIIRETFSTGILSYSQVLAVDSCINSLFAARCKYLQVFNIMFLIPYPGGIKPEFQAIYAGRCHYQPGLRRDEETGQKKFFQKSGILDFCFQSGGRQYPGYRNKAVRYSRCEKGGYMLCKKTVVYFRNKMNKTYSPNRNIYASD